MLYIILGTAHEFQPRHPGLKTIILNLARANGIKLIAEEGPRASVAAQVAVSLGLPHALIDMTEAQRKAAGIYEALCNRPRFVKDENGRKALDEDGDFIPRRCYLKHADGVREEHWLNRVEQVQPQGTVLIVCGYMHLNLLAEKVKRRGNDVLQTVVFPSYLSETTFEILD